MQITYDISSFVDIKKLCKDKEYAKKLGVVVKSQKHPKVKKIEQELKDISNDDENWREKVMGLKAQLTKAKLEPKLHLIKYKKNCLTAENKETLGLLRSVIVYNGEIISFAPPKSLDFDKYIERTDVNMPNNAVEEFVEGTMINMFFNKLTQDWEIASRSNIGARCCFYQDKKITFRTMFLEAMNKLGYEFKDFEKKYCYSWILQHPDNRIVVPFTQPNLVLCRIYECKNLTVKEMPNPSPCAGNIRPPYTLYTRSTEGEPNISVHTTSSYIGFLPEFSNILDFKNINHLKDAIESGSYKYTLMGLVFRDPKTGIRTKVRNPTYEYVRKLKGNSPKLQYQYYTLRQMGAVRDFLKYYPEHKTTFEKFRKQIHEFTRNLHSNYIRCYVKKEKPLREFPFEYRTHMYNLHQNYINRLRNSGEIVKKHVVINYINNIPCDHLMSSINYPLKQQKVDEIKAVVNDLVENVIQMEDVA